MNRVDIRTSYRVLLGGRLSLVAFVLLVASNAFGQGNPEAAASSIVDLGTTPLARLEAGMTSLNCSVHGARLGMNWDRARAALDKKGLFYYVDQRQPRRVLIPAENPTCYFVIHSRTNRISEIGFCCETELHPDNRFFVDWDYWKKKANRSAFFGTTGRWRSNKNGKQYLFDSLGFVLRCSPAGPFYFVMVPPPRKPIPSEKPIFHWEERLEFFVLGYHKLNTPANFQALCDNIGKWQKEGAWQIDEKAATTTRSLYDEASKVTKVRLERQIAAMELAFREVLDDPDRTKTARVRVVGWTDPNLIKNGKYLDESINLKGLNTADLNIPSGQVLNSDSNSSVDEGNLILSQLRAYWASKEIAERLCAVSQSFRELCGQGRIQWVIVGGDTDTDAGRLNMEKRSIEITVNKNGETHGYDFTPMISCCASLGANGR